MITIIFYFLGNPRNVFGPKNANRRKFIHTMLQNVVFPYLEIRVIEMGRQSGLLRQHQLFKTKSKFRICKKNLRNCGTGPRDCSEGVTRFKLPLQRNCLHQTFGRASVKSCNQLLTQPKANSKYFLDILQILKVNQFKTCRTLLSTTRPQPNSMLYG